MRLNIFSNRGIVFWHQSDDNDYDDADDDGDDEDDDDEEDNFDKGIPSRVMMDDWRFF